MDAVGQSAAAARRPLTGIALLAGAGCLLAGAVFFGGGSGSTSVPVLGAIVVVVAAAAAAAAALGLLALPQLDRAGRVACLAGMGLVLWGGASIAWSIAGDRSWDALDKGLVYAAFGLVGIALSGRGPRAVRDAALVLAAVLGAALVWALAGKAVPGLFPDGGRAARLRSPIGYWNALALLADAAIPLGLWLAASGRGRVARLAGPLLVYAATLSILLTQSRAGLLAALAVTALWLWLSPKRVEGSLLGVLAATPAVAVLAWAFTQPALVEDGATRVDRVADGRIFAVLALAGAAVVVALVLLVPVQQLVANRRREVVRRLAVGAALLAVVGTIGFVAAVGDPFTWAVDQVSGSGASEVSNDPSRFGSLNTNNRTAWWGEAWDVFRAHPAGGTGARTFELARKRYRDDARNVAEPHSVPMQLLADTGIVGLVLGIACGGALGLGLVGSLRRLAGEERAAAVALVTLPAAYGLHALVDYDLDFLAVTGPTLLVAGLLLGAARPAARVPRGWLPAAGAGVVAAAVIAALVTPSLATRRVDASYAALDARDVASARDRARAARALNALSPEPLWALAAVESAAGRQRVAVAYLREATSLQPENPETWYQLGLTYQLALGDQCQAYAALNRSYTLDPNGERWIVGGPLDIARDAVNNGACEP